MRHPHSPRPEDGSERGIVLITVVLFVLMLGGLSIGFLSEGLAEKIAVTHRKSSLLALQICEAGAVRSQVEIFAMKDSGVDGVGNVSGQYGGGTYVVTARQDDVNPDRWILLASGTYDLTTRRVEIGIRRRKGADFVEGLFAKDRLVFNGDAQTDAYDSRLGTTWEDQAVHSDGAGDYALGRGDVGSNLDIDLHGTSAHVRGNAIPGPMSTTNMSGGPTVWGDVMPRRRTIDLPDLPLAEFEAALASNNNLADLGGPGGGHGHGGGGGGGGGGGAYNASTYKLTANGGTEEITLTGGVYFFSDVRFTGGATLRVTGPAVIYVTGDFDLGGGVLINTSGKPADLRINVHPYPLPPSHAPLDSRVKVNGGTQVAVTVYAPAADITVGGGDHVYGAIVGNQITVGGNTHFHYDLALGEAEVSQHVTLERLYWRDLGMPLRQ